MRRNGKSLKEQHGVGESGGFMITSSANPRVKQVAQWQAKAGERLRAGVFLAEGFKMYMEAPREWIREVYVSAGALERAGECRDILEKLEGTGYETVSEEVFRKMSDTQTPQGILCVMERCLDPHRSRIRIYHSQGSSPRMVPCGNSSGDPISILPEIGP